MNPADPKTFPVAPVSCAPCDDATMRRKGEQRGSVRKVGNTWHISFFEWQTDAAGNPVYRRVSRRVDGATSRRRAEAMGYEQWVAKANAPAACARGVATLKDFTETRFEADHIITLKKGGREHYHHILRVHILPGLGGIELRQITPALVQQLLSGKLAAGCSTQAVGCGFESRLPLQKQSTYSFPRQPEQQPARGCSSLNCSFSAHAAGGAISA